MQFELTEALIDDILFSMEDQEGEFFIDTEKSIISNMDEFDNPIEPDGDRYLPIPDWDSSNGFRLMERFAAQFHNPIVRGELSAALNRGKGVFRAFKDILGRHPEVERHWFAYKEREMKKEILKWYNALREEWGLERIGGEPEETGDLILEDFRFRPSGERDRAAAVKLHELCRSEAADTAETFGAEEGFPGDLALTAETVGGEFAGCIWGIRRGTSFHIAALEIKPEYRGLGIGETLISRFLERIDRRETGVISIELPAGSESFSRVLHRNGFRAVSVRYCINAENMPS
ncbi:MAG: GNAT family N-acetyltransferase [Treponema sp.]|jgi:ribosomal protein S18 acetylase RimI-like enzyme|nr:GNAT family N-acetyltransferase [Treponema sp.]